MSKIMIIGQFPPPIHGLSVALKSIMNSQSSFKKLKLTKLDISNNKHFLINLFKLFVSNFDAYYLTVSQTKMGNIRDMIILFLLIVLKRKKVIIHYHGGYYYHLYNREFKSLQRGINFYLLNKVEKIIVLSESLKSMFDKTLVNDDKLVVCENFVSDDALLNNFQYEEKMKILTKKEKMDVLYLSNFIKTKGYIEILESMKKLKNNNKIHGFTFHFAGHFFKKEDEVYFLNFLKENNLEKNTKYYGTVSGEDKKKLLLASDIFLLPTKYPKEGQPISIIEAMANGMLIISTNHAGIPDIVCKENNILMEHNHSEKIYNCLLNINKKDIVRANDYNRSKVMDNFMEKNYIDRLNKIFLEVLK